MGNELAYSFSKSERLCGHNAIDKLMSEGKWGATEHLKYCCLKREDTNCVNRLMISVPKRLFKRAVKRNLLKRRIREAYRQQKSLLSACGVDFLIFYKSPDILPYSTVAEELAEVLAKISSRLGENGKQ